MDDYEILGVDRNATPDEIKAAFRTKAKEFHPDVNHAPDAEEKFKQAQSAYQNIKDGPKPQVHDMGNMFRDAQYKNVWSVFEDLMNVRNQRNQDIHVQHVITLEQAYNGEDLTVSIDDRVILVKIPAGSDNGTRLRVPGAAPKANPALPAGDLYIIIRIQDHQVYRREGKNLMITIDVDVMDLVHKKPVKVKTISGGETDVSLPKGYQSLDSIVVPGHGMKIGNHVGDLLVYLNIKF